MWLIIGLVVGWMVLWTPLFFLCPRAPLPQAPMCGTTSPYLAWGGIASFASAIGLLFVFAAVNARRERKNAGGSEQRPTDQR